MADTLIFLSYDTKQILDNQLAEFKQQVIDLKQTKKQFSSLEFDLMTATATEHLEQALLFKNAFANNAELTDTEIEYYSSQLIDTAKQFKTAVLELKNRQIDTPPQANCT